MNTIKARVRDGKIETEAPLNLPDGTELLIMRSDAEDEDEDDREDTPEAIAAWHEWLNSAQPLVFTAEEREAMEADKKGRREWELAHFDEWIEKLRRLWECDDTSSTPTP